MPPHIYFQILILTIGRDLFIEAFGVTDFLNDGLVQNALALLAGYAGDVPTNRSLDFNKFLPPIISCAQPTYDFVTQGTGVPRIERVATIDLIYSATAGCAKIGDLPFNAGAGDFIYLLRVFYPLSRVYLS